MRRWMICAFIALGGAMTSDTAHAAVDTFIYQDLDQLKQQDFNGDDVRALPTQAFPDHFALSAYGNKIAYTTYDQHLYVYFSNGTATDLYFGPPGDAVRDPQFSPDDRSVIFTHARSGDYNIFEVDIETRVLRNVVSWPGNQGFPVYRADGTKIAFTSTRDAAGKDLRGSYIFVANADGSGAVKVAAGSDPAFSPDGSRLVYESGGDIYTVGSNGSGRSVLVRGGYSPDWSPDGLNIAYIKPAPFGGGTYYGIWLISPDGSNNRAYIAPPGRSQFNPSFRQPSTKITYDDYLASALAPVLRFDSSESWRPLDVERFLGEPGHTVDGAPVLGFGTLRTYPFTSSTLDIFGDGAETNYTSPNPECLTGGLRDCDSGSNSLGYYHVSQASPGGYRYLDYWYFYRYNYFGSLPVANDFNHEADWESVTVAPTQATRRTFDFASFSAHGTWYSYLRDYLSCDNGSAGSCGSESNKIGHRVNAFVTNGDHAGYGVSCSEWFPGTCLQADMKPERGHDGAVHWGADRLTQFDPNVGWSNPAVANWVDWPGKWGRERDVSSPAAAGTGNGSHYVSPWEQTGCNSGPCVQPSRVAVASGLAASRSRDVDTSARSCGNWFNADVTAVLCDPRRLGRAIGRGGLTGAGGFKLRLPGRNARSASAPGLVQAMGPPLVAGGPAAAIRGRVTPGTVLFVRAADRRREVVARFALPAMRHAVASVRARRDAAGRIALLAILGSGEVLRPTEVHAVRRRTRAGGSAPAAGPTGSRTPRGHGPLGAADTRP